MRKWEMCKSGYRPSNTLAYSAATKAACLISVQNCTDRAPKLKKECLTPPRSLMRPLTLFWAGSGITLLDGGAIMARMDSSHPEAVCRHPKAQK